MELNVDRQLTTQMIKYFKVVGIFTDNIDFFVEPNPNKVIADCIRTKYTATRLNRMNFE